MAEVEAVVAEGEAVVEGVEGGVGAGAEDEWLSIDPVPAFAGFWQTSKMGTLPWNTFNWPKAPGHVVSRKCVPSQHMQELE